MSADNANSKSQQPWGWGNREDDTSSWHLKRLKAIFRRQVCPKNKHCHPRWPLSPSPAKGRITPMSCSHCQSRGTGDMETKSRTRGPRKDTAMQEQPLRTLICRVTLTIRQLGFSKDWEMFLCLSARQLTDLISTEKHETVSSCSWDCHIFNFTRKLTKNGALATEEQMKKTPGDCRGMERACSAQSSDSTRRQHRARSDGAGSAEGSRCGANVCVGVEGVYEHNK